MSDNVFSNDRYVNGGWFQDPPTTSAQYGDMVIYWTNEVRDQPFNVQFPHDFELLVE